MRKTDVLYMRTAQEYANQSPDRGRKTGCVIVSWAGSEVSRGWNIFPTGVNLGVEARHQRPAKYLYTEHAERMACYQAARCGYVLQDCTMYLTWFPCADCARGIIECGIRRLVYGRQPDVNDAVFGPSFTVALEMLEEAGVQLDFLPIETALQAA